MWVLGMLGAAAAIVFAGSCFLYSGWTELEGGVAIGMLSLAFGAFATVRLVLVTRGMGTRGLYGRFKALPMALMMKQTSESARRVVFLFLLWWGLVFVAIDLSVVGALRHFVL
jgi:hypothetical protein